MARLGEDAHGGASLDDLTEVHHQNPIAQHPDHVEIVRDEQVTHVEPLSQIGQQAEDHRLHGDVEGRSRLVEDQELRTHADGPRDPHALLLPAGELVRKSAQQLPRQTDEVGP